jgi:hypothetical protein
MRYSPALRAQRAHSEAESALRTGGDLRRVLACLLSSLVLLVPAELEVEHADDGRAAEGERLRAVGCLDRAGDLRRHSDVCGGRGGRGGGQQGRMRVLLSAQVVNSLGPGGVTSIQFVRR